MNVKVRARAAVFALVFLLGGCALTRETAQQDSATVLAFDGAEGAGRFAAGGRGGVTIRVTNLNDAGAGSLRAAIDHPQPRIVVFDVEGTIWLARDLIIREPRITIDGRSAPGRGITLANHGLIVRADDVILRYLRSRLGDRGGKESDAVSVESGRRIILDHLSASWSVDETLSASARYERAGIYDLTVQWCIISESLRSAGHSKGNHGYGSLIRGGRGSRFSFHHNLWAHHDARMPRPGNYEPAAKDPRGALMDFRSNVFYNWGGTAAGYNADTDSNIAYNFIDNTYLPGPDTKGRLAFREQNPLARSYFAGNSMDGVIPPDPWSLTAGAMRKLTTPIDVAPVDADPAPRGFERVLREAGASHVRDIVDARIVHEVRTRSGKIINSQREVGGWPP